MTKKARKEGKAADLVKNNLFIILFFLASTAFFIYQHSASISWDYSVFVLNAKYWFSSGSYFELFRPPLMPFTLSVLGIFGWAAAEYIYIVLASALFAYSSVRLAESLGINKNIFYMLMLNPYVLRLGLINGTEILSLALLELFIAGILSKKDSGHLLGLAALARYNAVLFLPLLVFYKDIKKIIMNCLLFALPFVPWFFYNYINSGNIFMSIADSFANNVFFRRYLNQGFNWMHLEMALNFLIPLVAVGAAYSLYIIIFEFMKAKSFRKFSKIVFEKRIGEIIMFIVFFGVLYSYNNIPIKDPRYLFNLARPSAYFSVIGINCISSKLKMKEAKFAIVSVCLLLTVFSAPLLFEERETEGQYANAINRLEYLGAGNCSVLSNGWVFLNYLGRTSASSPWPSLVGHYINEGSYILLFYSISEPSYALNESFTHAFPVLYENKDFIILGNTSKCAPIKTVDSTYMAGLNMSVYLVRNETIDIEPCNILFEGKIGNKMCNLANLRWKE